MKNQSFRAAKHFYNTISKGPIADQSVREYFLKPNGLDVGSC